jgi:PAS domain S-box-containing protein
LSHSQGDRDRPQGVPDGQLLAASSLGPAFEASPNGLLVVNASATIVAANSALQRMFGYQSDEVLGKPLELLVPTRLREAHQDLRNAFFLDPQRRAMGSGRELHALHASGRQFPVEIGLNPMTMPQGEMVLASIVDTSQRRGLEAAFGRIFESATQGMVLVGSDGCIALLNERLAAMLGHVRADLLGKRLEVLLPERYRAHHGGLMRTYREAPGTRDLGVGRELTALHASGAELPVEIGLSAVNWQGEEMTLATVIDISVRRRIEMELKQANDSLREFTHVASHDLKSPLRGIADLVEWMREDLADNPQPKLTHNLDRISVRIKRMEQLITKLLRYARSEQVYADCQPIDFAVLVADILEVDPVPSDFIVDITVSAEPISAPQTPIETVLRNLISNAVKHHDRSSGRIGVEVVADGGYSRVSVTDDGPGIALSAQQRVFRLFQTASSAERAGSGLGLALAKRLVEIHGGRIELLSPVLDGRGCSFRFWWPSSPRRTSDE